LQKFYEAVFSALLKHVDLNTIKAVILASPGFTKESSHRYLISEASRTNNRSVIDNKSKFLQIHCSSYHKQALLEVLKDPTIVAQLSDIKYAQEVRAMNDFTNMLSEDEDRAYYGVEHVSKALERGAIRTLLISDSLFRSEDVKTRRRYIKMVEDVRSLGKSALIFSSLHASGERKYIVYVTSKVRN
jgi:protein pelota